MTDPDFIDVAGDTARAKARMSAKEWRDKYFKWAMVELSPKQSEFQNILAKYAYFRSGNQSGKTFGIADLITQVALGRFRSTYKGWRPKLRKDGAYAVTIWCLSVSSQMVREGLGTILFGDVAGGNTGTGLIPKDAIVSIQMGRGIAGQIDYAIVKRDDGLLTKIAFKSYEQGRAAMQAEPVHLVVCDELLDDLAAWNELIARTTATGGILRLTATERLQSSPVALWFRDNAGPDCVTLTGSVDDATHLTAAEKEAAKSQYKSEAELQTRYYGLPFQGGGSVFTTPISEILERMEPAKFPVWYKYLISVDWSHFGRSESSSQFACTFWAIDSMSGVARIFEAFKMRGIPEEHVSRIINAGGAGIPIAWPADGHQGQADGGTIAQLYKKASQGQLRFLASHATFENGSVNFESGITLLDNLLSTGRLKVADHLTAWRDEYLQYERDEAGQVLKRQDDLLSATRIGAMSLRFARGLDPSSARYRPGMFMATQQTPIASAGDPFDLSYASD